MTLANRAGMSSSTSGTGDITLGSALGAVVLNLVMIGSVLFLAPFMGTRLEDKIFGLAIGVLVAGLAQAFFRIEFDALEALAFVLGSLQLSRELLRAPRARTQGPARGLFP